MLTFVTGNAGKLLDAQKVLARFHLQVRGQAVDFDEPRSDDLAVIARAKIRQAARQIPAPLFVQDSGLFIDALRGFPGTQVNFALRTIGMEGIRKLLVGEKNRRCCFRQCVGYWDGAQEHLFFSEMPGVLTEELCGVERPEQPSPLWRIFRPDGADKTVAEFTQEELEAYMDRDGRALQELGCFLQGKEQKE